MSRRVLHILSQRPSLTGSGITLDAMVRCAAAAGWSQRCVVGVPAADPTPAVGELVRADIEPLVFETADLMTRKYLRYRLAGPTSNCRCVGSVPDMS